MDFNTGNERFPSSSKEQTYFTPYKHPSKFKGNIAIESMKQLTAKIRKDIEEFTGILKDVHEKSRTTRRIGVGIAVAGLGRCKLLKKISLDFTMAQQRTLKKVETTHKSVVAAIAIDVQFLFWWLGAAGLIMIVAGSVFTAVAMQEESKERKNTTADVVRIRQLIGKGQNFSRRLREVAENLNQHHRNVKRAKFGGALSAFVGVVVTVVAAVLTPWTGKGILRLAGAGMVLSGAGDLVKNGSSLIEMFIQKINGKDLQKEWNEIISAVYTECQFLDNMPQMCTTNLHGYTPLFVNGLNILRSGNTLQTGLNIVSSAHEGAYNLGTASKHVGLKKASAGIQAIGTTEFFLTLAMLPNNVTEMVRAAVDLMGDQKPEASLLLLKLADCTEEITRGLRETSEMLRLFSDKHD